LVNIERTNWVKLPLPQYDVGVIPDGTSCPDDANTRVQYFMDNEDYKEESSTTPWTGGITIADAQGNTSFVFCRVDGQRFRNLAAASSDQNNYAVLKLGQFCPPGSKEFTRLFDNENTNNINHVVAGAFSPNAYQRGALGSWTKLRFCFFNSDPTAPLMSEFPSLGFDYGVFAPSSHRLALRTGRVFTDDEDGGNNSWEPPDAAWKPEATRIISEGLNTTLHTIQVRRRLVNGMQTSYFSGAQNEQRGWTFEVPPGTSRVSFSLSASSSVSGDADLHVRFGAMPTLSSFDCRPYHGDSNEVCEFTNPQPGTWYVMVNGYSAYSNVALRASLNGAIQGVQTVWSNSTMGGGSGALAWLTGDVDGDGRTDLLQPWNNNGRLAIDVYRSTGTGYALGSSTPMPSGSGALAWLTGDVNGDGRTDIIQPWNNNGGLAFDVHRSTGTGYALAFSKGMPAGSPALAWLTGDMNGDGLTDILQPWNNNGALGLIVHQSTGNDYFLGFNVGNMGQGSQALAWLTGDMDGDGRTDLLQPWNNNGALGLIVYRSTGSGYSVGFNVGNMGQGSPALAWLTGDMDGDGRTDLLQPWNNNGALGLRVYRSTGSGYSVGFNVGNMGQGVEAIRWLTGDVDGDGRTDLLQPWNNNGALGLRVYRSTGSGYALWFSSENMGQGPWALAWLMGDMQGDGSVELLQPWDNAGRLGLLVYGAN
jgi:hypothetical protein